MLPLLDASFLQRSPTTEIRSWGLVVGFLRPLKRPLRAPSLTLLLGRHLGEHSKDVPQRLSFCSGVSARRKWNSCFCTGSSRTPPRVLEGSHRGPLTMPFTRAATKDSLCPEGKFFISLRSGIGKRWAYHPSPALSGELGTMTRLATSECNSEQHGPPRSAQAP